MTNTQNIKDIIVILFILIYIYCSHYNYKWYRIALSKSDDVYKDGKWSNTDAGLAEFLFTFLPLINIIVYFLNSFDSPYRNRNWDKPKKNAFNKIFNLKK